MLLRGIKGVIGIGIVDAEVLLDYRPVLQAVIDK